ncbi:MAG: metallophosphoesterase, partial [Firmicutes bacterium]|nr:metallophosphoesterase [Bacillota bacterium]
MLSIRKFDIIFLYVLYKKTYRAVKLRAARHAAGSGGEELSHLYAIADLHLSNDPSCANKNMDVFGSAWEGHDKRLRDVWLRLVEPEDTVIVAGDISWALRLQQALADLAWLDSLPGTKLLVRGNHDLWWSSMKKMRGLFGSVKFIQNDSFELDDSVVCGTRGWICPGEPDFSEETDRKIYDRELLRLEMSLKSASACGKEITAAMHFPPMNRKQEPSGFTDLFKAFGVKRVVYGHLHGAPVFKNGPQGEIDGIEYSLVSLDKVQAVPL